MYSEIQGILANVSSFKFLLQTCIWYNILSTIKSLSDYLQSPTINLSSASSLVKGTERSIAATCEKFEVFYEEASTWATELEIEPVLPSGRVQRRKQMPGELAMDEPICDPKNKFKAEFFYALIDRFSSQIQERFSDLHAIASKFNVLYPNEFLTMSDSSFEHELSALADMYNEDVDMDDVLSEFNVLRKQQELVADIDLTPQGVFKRLISSGLQIAYPNVCTLYRIFLTLPITSATVERSMSKLKLIKNYLRSTMADDRLTALALISIEKDLATTLNYQETISTFASMKERRMKL